MILIIIIVFVGVENFVYVDESGIKNDCRRIWARSERGVKIHDVRPGKKSKRTNVVAGLWGKKHVAVKCYYHTTSSAFFEEWFEWKLLSVIPVGSVIILDNASFHRKKALFQIAGRYGVYVLFLPTYSPDFNPIEHSWANLKRWLIDHLHRFTSIDFAIEHYFDTFHY